MEAIAQIIRALTKFFMLEFFAKVRKYFSLDKILGKKYTLFGSVTISHGELAFAFGVVDAVILLIFIFMILRSQFFSVFFILSFLVSDNLITKPKPFQSARSFLRPIIL